MAASKYDKYFIKEPIEIGKFAPNMRYSSQFPDANLSIRWHLVKGPWLIEAEPHVHDFDQFTCLMGADTSNIREFDAEVELSLGVEGEKRIINATTIIYIPKGLVHGPLNFKKVNKPFMFINVLLTSEYVKKIVPS